MRESGAGLLLPRLIPIGDPELDDRIGGALEPLDDEPIPPAIDRLERSLTLASIVRGGCASSAEALRLSADLARALDALEVEEINPERLRNAVGEASDLARHWERSLEKLQLIVDQWPRILADHGAIDLAERRNRVLRRIADRWKTDPPPGFTVAAGITTAAPAVAELVARVARMPGGMVVLPGLWLANSDARFRMGCARPRRARGGRGDPSAISAQARPRPDRRCPPGSPAVALFRSRTFTAGAVAGDRQRDGGARLLAQMGDIAPGRTAAGRDPASPSCPTAPPKPRRSPWRCARRSKRRARPPHWSLPTGSLPSASSGCSRGGGSRPTTVPERPCRRPRPGPCCAGSHRLRPRNSDRLRCWHWRTTRWSAGKARSGSRGWTPSGRST